MLPKRQQSFRRLLVSSLTLCAMLALQVPWTAEVADAPVSAFVPEIGIEKTIAQPIEASIGIPVLVRIPSIQLDAQVVGVGLIDNKKMDVPADPAHVGWYTLGVRPGMKGKAVLDGHLDMHGKPGVFWDLEKVNIGDTIEVTDDLGAVRLFRVRTMKIYDVNNAPMNDIFGAANSEQLHLITCAGVWRKELDHYDKRLVVFSDLIAP